MGFYTYILDENKKIKNKIISRKQFYSNGHLHKEKSFASIEIYANQSRLEHYINGAKNNDSFPDIQIFFKKNDEDKYIDPFDWFLNPLEYPKPETIIYTYNKAISINSNQEIKMNIKYEKNKEITTKTWELDNKLHRIDGPALIVKTIYNNGDKNIEEVFAYKGEPIINMNTLKKVTSLDKRSCDYSKHLISFKEQNNDYIFKKPKKRFRY
jgi:hypothetical protein